MRFSVKICWGFRVQYGSVQRTSIASDRPLGTRERGRERERGSVGLRI